jgi:hypothetical protein
MSSGRPGRVHHEATKGTEGRRTGYPVEYPLDEGMVDSQNPKFNPVVFYVFQAK